MEELKVDRTKLYTQTEFAKMKGVTRQRVNQMVKSKELKTIQINGAKLIYIK